jgi:hypothetical protein
VQYRDVPDLIRKNADYLVDSVSRNLRHLDLNPTAPDVLRVILDQRYVRFVGTTVMT